MIGFDFEYYRPDTLEEAVQVFKDLDSKGKKPKYYSGGTEIISLARMNNIYTEGVIDIKSIPECNVLEFKGNKLEIGAAVTLTSISESNLFPLLSSTVRRVADHTIQCKITLGGNICGTIIYREAILPLFLTDCETVIMKEDGQQKTISIHEVFNRNLKLSNGEFIAKFLIEKEYLSLKYSHVKRTRSEKIDYPLITAAAINKDNRVRIAFSGVCNYPFRSLEIESHLNDSKNQLDKRINFAIESLPEQITNDILASADYRKFVLKNIIEESMCRIGVI